jgi:hypothetical protein
MSCRYCLYSKMINFMEQSPPESHLVEEFQPFIQLEGSLPCSQKLVTCPVRYHLKQVHILQPYFLQIHLNIILPLPFRYPD